MRDYALYTTAIHEAGYAVAHRRLWPDGRIIMDISIEEDAPRLRSHRSEQLFAPIIDNADETARQDAEFAKDAICSCAGYAALIAAGYPEDEAILGCRSYLKDAKGAVPLETSKSKARALMRRPQNIEAVARIAEELMWKRRVSGEEIGVLINVADGVMSEDEYAERLATGQFG